MCGICGYINFNNPGLINKSVLETMNDATIHRGPDDDGYYVNGNIGLAMRRLSIIDLDTGKQPICNEDKSIWVVFNGEIYNFPVVKEELLKLGHSFTTKSDTEVIVHAYEEWGDRFVGNLNGMFAIAIWDEKKRKLLLIRDRVGVKPLHYTFTNGKFIFASEIKSILQHPDVNREIDFYAIDNFLRYKYIPAPDTAFKGIKQVRPGSMLFVSEDGTYNETQYWELQIPTISSVNIKKSGQSLDSYIEGLREVLSNAVRRRLISDVPLGAFLSGGIDSSIVVGLMSKIMDEPVKTFSMGFEQKSFNELKYAKIVAERFGTDHHEFVVDPGDVFELIWEITKAIDEPYGDAGAIPNYLVSQHTRKHVTVALSGIGADEAFAGYERYWVDKAYRHYQKIPAVLRNVFIEKAVEQLPVSNDKKSIIARAKKFIQASKLPLYKRYVDIVTVFTDKMKEKLYSDALKSEIVGNDSENILLDKFEQTKVGDFLAESFYVDLKTILVDDYLMLGDRVSMANSLEVRVPFLDHTLLEYAATIPSSYKLKGYTTKYILKEAYEDLLPKEILNRGKYGFESPIGPWIRNELKNTIEDMLLGERTRKRRFFNYDYIEELLQDHYNKINDYKKHIFSLLTFEIWCREYLD